MTRLNYIAPIFRRQLCAIEAWNHRKRQSSSSHQDTLSFLTRSLSSNLNVSLSFTQFCLWYRSTNNFYCIQPRTSVCYMEKIKLFCFRLLHPPKEKNQLVSWFRCRHTYLFRQVRSETDWTFCPLFLFIRSTTNEPNSNKNERLHQNRIQFKSCRRV